MSRLWRRETASPCDQIRWLGEDVERQVGHGVEVEDPAQQINIVAIGIKHRNRVSIGGELYDI